jgi:hypothetical protein
MHEREVEAHLVQRVRELGGECRKVQWIGRRGAPDRLVMLPVPPGWDPLTSTTVWVELKAPGQKAKPHQIREHQRMRDMGQCVVVIDSIDAVEELLA